MITLDRTCERCGERSRRRFRCRACGRLVCARCCTRRGRSGQGARGGLLAVCRDCPDRFEFTAVEVPS